MNTDDFQEIRTGRREIYDGVVVHLTRDTVRLPSGGEGVREVIWHRGAVCVVPLTEDGDVLLVRQYRYPQGTETLELPAGGLQYRGEPTLDAARRELKEETGYAATSMELLLNLRTTVAFCNEKIDIYLAKGLVRGQQHLDDDEYLGVEIHDLEELKGMIFRGEIEDAKTIAGILAYADRLREEESRRG